TPFQGAYRGRALPALTAINTLTGGVSPGVLITTSIPGGVVGTPAVMTSAPSTLAALEGNNAQVRLIVDGSGIPAGAGDVGFVIDASNSILRGLAIDGFTVGVSVPRVSDVGNLIQGNCIGVYATYPV